MNNPIAVILTKLLDVSFQKYKMFDDTKSDEH